MEFSRGQTQALTMVLITTITLGGVSVAYIWGTPLIEKQQGKAELQDLETSVENLRSAILQTANEGGSQEVLINTRDGRIEVNPEQDYIDIFTNTPGAPYAPGGWILLNGNERQNLSIAAGNFSLKGETVQGVIAVKTAAGGGSSVVQYRIEFRNMKTEGEPRMEAIDLISKGRETASGEVRLNIASEGQSRSNLEIPGLGDLSLTRKKVAVDIR